MVGPPGSGKGTQAAFLSEALGVPAVSTGEMLRSAVAARSALGERVESIMQSGALVDDETMAQVVQQRLGEADAQSGFLLDGYPRNLGQAETLAGILERLETQLDIVLVLDVPEEELIRRALARKRDDDKVEVIRERLSVYKNKTEPLIDYYRDRGILSMVDGFQAVDSVTAALLGEIRKVGQV
ncbi:MAG: adenylate kinase [Deltaproteobacteria bacterium]|nr:adenylate kinase [Deltaproteobacteria bacterium]